LKFKFIIKYQNHSFEFLQATNVGNFEKEILKFNPIIVAIIKFSFQITGMISLNTGIKLR